MKSGLARELRENAGYLLDSGLRSTANLMEAAAAEIERVSGRITELEGREAQSEVGRTPIPALIRLFRR